MAAIHELGAAEAARRIRAGTRGPSNLPAACLRRTAALEPAAGAWVRLDGVAAARRGRVVRARDRLRCGAAALNAGR